MARDEPATAHPASTVVLLRDVGAPRIGLETFLLQRPGSASFMAHAHVFPGGRVEADDLDRRWEARCAGADAVRRPWRDTATPEALLAHAVAAVRELFEEAGVLLARDTSGRMLSAGGEDADPALRDARTALEAGARFHEVCEPRGWQLALDLLSPLSHWVTPAMEPRRFDTRFYLAELPAGQRATACGRETVAGDWVTPADALARHARGEITLAPPTHRTLDDLAGCTSAEMARSLASGLAYVRIEPRVHREGDQTWLLLPGDPLYPAPPGAGLRPPTRFVAAGRHRFVPLVNP